MPSGTDRIRFDVAGVSTITITSSLLAVVGPCSRYAHGADGLLIAIAIVPRFWIFWLASMTNRQSPVTHIIALKQSVDALKYLRNLFRIKFISEFCRCCCCRESKERVLIRFDKMTVDSALLIPRTDAATEERMRCYFDIEIDRVRGTPIPCP
jgi:hypothetical protein